MDSKASHDFALGSAATLLGAAGFWFGTGLTPSWWCTWLAPLPLLLLATRVRTGVAALAAFVAVLIGSMNQWHYVHDLIKLPMVVLLLQSAIASVVFVLTTLLYRRLAMRGHILAAMFSVPLLWTTVFFANAASSPHGTWGDLAYTQMDATVLIQIAAVTGIWGIGFTLLLGATWIATLVNDASPLRERAIAGVIGAVLLGAVFGFGAWRLGDSAAERSVKIGLASLPGSKPLAPMEPAGEALIRQYLDELTPLVDAGAQYLVIPEVAFGVEQADIPPLRDFAQQRGVTLVTGVDLKIANTPERNASLAFGPQGGAPNVCWKHHLVPVFEDRFTPGTDITLLPNGKVGLSICKDNDFPALLRRYGARDVQLMLIPAWDFNLDGWLHSRMAILRGVESGFAIARSARDGRLSLSDDRGRVLAEASSEEGPAHLIGELPLRRTRTVYARFGDWFGWVCVAGSIAVLGLAYPRRRRQESWLGPE